jgi:hypothetical protein
MPSIYHETSAYSGNRGHYQEMSRQAVYGTTQIGISSQRSMRRGFWRRVNHVMRPSSVFDARLLYHRHQVSIENATYNRLVIHSRKRVMRASWPRDS